MSEAFIASLLANNCTSLCHERRLTIQATFFREADAIVAGVNNWHGVQPLVVAPIHGDVARIKCIESRITRVITPNSSLAYNFDILNQALFSLFTRRANIEEYVPIFAGFGLLEFYLHANQRRSQHAKAWGELAVFLNDYLERYGTFQDLDPEPEGLSREELFNATAFWKNWEQPDA